MLHFFMLGMKPIGVGRFYRDSLVCWGLAPSTLFLLPNGRSSPLLALSVSLSLSTHVEFPVCWKFHMNFQFAGNST